MINADLPLLRIIGAIADLRFNRHDCRKYIFVALFLQHFSTAGDFIYRGLTGF